MPPSPSKWTFSLVVASATTVALLAHAESGDEWGIRALPLQHQIDVRVPLSDSHWLGTHNSFDNRDDDDFVDFNQPDGIKKQLAKGVRQIGIDIHYADGAGTDTGNNEVRMCHNNTSWGKYVGQECGSQVGDRLLKHGLDDVIEWLNDGHKDQVVILRIDLAKSARHNINKVERVLENHLGDRMYRPGQLKSPSVIGTSGCTAIPPGLTKRDVLLAGKNLLLLTGSDCVSDGGFNGLAFYESSAGNDNVKDPKMITKDNVIYRAVDGQTRDHQLEEDKAVKIKPSNVRDWLAAGLNIFEVYGYSATDDKWRTSGELPVGPDDMVWTWRKGRPSTGSGGTQDCGALNSDGTITDEVCTQSYRVACRLAGGGWGLSKTPGRFADAAKLCAGLEATSQFDVPGSYPDLQKLKQVMTQDSVGQAWISYHDQSVEGVWQANAVVKAHAYSTQYGSTNGRAFSDTSEVARDLHTLSFRRVTKVVMRYGERMDQVGLVYSGGREVHHGGSGGGLHELSLGSGEHVTRYRICTNSEKGVSARVYYLKLITDKGNSLAGGNDKSATCTEASLPAGQELVGFVGREGDGLDQLGFISRRID